MPESYRKLALHPNIARQIPTLSKFTGPDLFIKIRCANCRITHRYFPQDLLQICGDVNLDEVVRRFRCEKCKRKELEITLHSAAASEKPGLRIRKLMQIKTLRRPVWKDIVY